MSMAELIRNMAAAGATPEAIAIAVEAVEAVQYADVERRAKRAAQKRKERDASRDNEATVARQDCDRGATVEAKGFPEVSPQRDINQTPHPNPSKNAAAASLVSILTENCLSEATALAVVAHRKTKKSPLTPHSAGLLRKSLLACGNPEAAAAEMLLRGWTAVKPEWLKDSAAQGKPLVSRPEPDRTGSIWVPAESAPWRAWQQAKGSGYLAARKKDRPGYPDGGAWLPTEYPEGCAA